MSRELLRHRLMTTDDEDAIEASHRLFFVVERLDIMAYEPTGDGMVKVTAQMWRDQISPWVATVRNALDRVRSTR